MERNSIITWKDAFKLAFGIMLGLTSTLLIIIGISDNELIFHKSEINNTMYDESYYNEYYAIPTVEDVLNERREHRHILWADSIYMEIPEDILTNILVEKGTQLSIEKIVEEYLSIKSKNDTGISIQNK